MPSKNIEVRTLLSAVLPDSKVKKKEFAERYCRGNKWDAYAGAKNSEELHCLLSGTLMIRRRKAEVLLDLPDKTRQRIWLPVDDSDKRKLQAQQARLTEARALVGSLGENLMAGLKNEQRQALMDLWRETAKIKTGTIQAWVKDVLENDVKFIIFGHHRVMLDGIQQACQDCGVYAHGEPKPQEKSNRKQSHSGKSFIRIDGETDQQKRNGLVQAFQNDDSVQVAILSMKAAGTGLNLTAASTVMFAELQWTPADIEQAESRAHRIGQARGVHVQFLLVRDSIDEILWDMLKNKLNNMGLALDGKREDFKEAAAADLTTGTAVTNGGCGGVSGVPVGMRPIDAYFQPCGANGGATGLGEGSGVGMGQGAGVCGKPIDAYFQPVGATGQALQGTVNNGHAGPDNTAQAALNAPAQRSSSGSRSKRGKSGQSSSGARSGVAASGGDGYVITSTDDGNPRPSKRSRGSEACGEAVGVQTMGNNRTVQGAQKRSVADWSDDDA